MTVPIRIQLSRRKGFDLQEHSRSINGLDAINCARPGKWGNPFRVGDPIYYRTKGDAWRERPTNAEEAVAQFRKFIMNPANLPGNIFDLRGKNLACWCKIGDPCHADVLLELANNPICEAV